MKKKQRCLLNRFAALVAALMLCAALCMPCFASNNASTQKWVIVAEANMANEMGTESKYFHISPYSNGALYRTRIVSQVAAIRNDLFTSDTPAFDWWVSGLNYPDWWRSPVPLGSRAYIQIDDPRIIQIRGSDNGSFFSQTTLSHALQFDLVNPKYGFDVSQSYTSSALSLNSSVLCYPVSVARRVPLTGSPPSNGINSVATTGLSFNKFSGSSSASMAIENFTQIIYGMQDPLSIQIEFDFDLSPVSTLYNASSDSLVILAHVPAWETTYSNPRNYVLECSAIFSYWVSADKLPAGLQVGDEFPANNDAFESMREDLLEQFPEAAENIENGKSTLTGWNDTETVDTDVASTAMSALNAMFQNLGSFLFIISLMVFGAVVLRMFIKKAVDG